MAITAISPYLFPPAPIQTLAGGPTLSTDFVMNAVNREFAWFLRIPKTGTLDFIEFGASVTNTPDNPMHISFRDLVVATYKPSAVIDQFRHLTVVGTGAQWLITGSITDDGTNGGVKRAVTVGDRLAVVMKFDPFVAGDSISPQSLAGVALPNMTTQGFQTTIDAGVTWLFTTPNCMRLIVRYDDGSIAYNNDTWIPALAIATNTYNSGSTPDEIGNRFEFPVETEINAIWLRGDLDGDYTVCIYDDTNTLVSSLSLASTERAITSGNNIILPIAPVTVPANTTYRVTLLPTTVTNLSLYNYTVNTNDLFGAVAGGTEMYYTSRTGGGAFTDDTVRRAYIGVQVSGVDVSAASGGASAHAFA